MQKKYVLISISALFLAFFQPVWSAAAGDSPAPSATAEPEKPAEVELTPEEKAEKEARRACKADICAAFHNRKVDGPDIACSVTKSWRKEQVEKLAAKVKMSWNNGRVRCTSDVKLKRQGLIKAMIDDKSLLQLEPHKVNCTIEKEKADPSEITFAFEPKVTFAKGKAVKAELNWGKIEAPALIKSAMWTATATDNTLNLLGSTMVEDINDFIDKKCAEVKEDWAGK